MNSVVIGSGFGGIAERIKEEIDTIKNTNHVKGILFSTIFIFLASLFIFGSAGIYP